MPQTNTSLIFKTHMQRFNKKKYTKESECNNGPNLRSKEVTEERCSGKEILYDRQSELRDQGVIDSGGRNIKEIVAQTLMSFDDINQFLLKGKRIQQRQRRRKLNTTLYIRDENSFMTIKDKKIKRRKKGKRHSRHVEKRQKSSAQKKVKQFVKTYFKKTNLVPVNSNIRYNRKTRRMFKKCLASTLTGHKNCLKVKMPGSKSTSLSVLKDILFKLTQNQFKQTLMIYPVSGQSLNNYLDSMENTNQLPSDSMKFELIRLKTFSRYPENAPVRPIRLAEAGFYYTGNGIEVRCFSCGKSYTDWVQSDSPRDVHFRISPHCEHLRGNDDANIATESGTENRSNASGATQSQCNGLGNNTENSEQTMPRHIQEHQAQQQRQSNPGPQRQQQMPLGHQQTQNNATHCHIDNTTHERQDNSQNTQLSRNYDPLGINFERPKYQAYAVLTVRISSFNGWPSHLTQSPREMATAGYFYAGYSDYCRCFFCGGGLRNWDAGDDPWVEHAKWFPRCPFLRMNRGIDFVELVQQRLAEVERSGEKGTDFQLTEGATGSATGNVPDDIWSHPSIQSVIEMGYSRDIISDALSIIKDKTCHKSGDSCPSAAEVLETIFSIEQGATGTDKKDNAAKPEIKSEDNKECNQSLEAVSNGIETLDITDTQSLMEENRQLKEDRLCKICMDNDASIAFLPCGHLVCCGDCAPAMRKCPVCRNFIRGTVKTWLV